MFVINPVQITDAVLTNSNVTEADQAEYSSVTAYTINQKVMVTTTAGGAATATHGIYTALGSTTGNDPTLAVAGTPSAHWSLDGYTNRFKMFDGVVQSQTVFAGGIDVEFTPATYTNSLSLINVDAATVDVVMTSTADGEVYNESYSMTSYSGIMDWYAYYFTPIERITELVITDLPSYLDAVIEVSVNDTGDAKCGELVLGNIHTIGESLHGANLGIIDYSVKSTNATTGETSITQGAYARRSQFDVLCTYASTPFTYNFLSSIRSTPVVWVADPDNGATVVYGYFREFNVILSDHTSSLVNLQIEGLT